jgi:hypothetical protein
MLYAVCTYFEVYSVIIPNFKTNCETHDKHSVLIYAIQYCHVLRFADEDEEVDMITPKKKGGGCG